MMTVAAPDSALVQRANLNIATAVMAKSGPNVSDSLLGHAINEIRASHSVAELAGANNMPMVVSAVEIFLARNAEADRPRNLYGAEAAQLAAQSGHHGGHWQHEGGPSGRYGLLLAGRGSRAVANDGGDESASGGGNSRSSVAANGTGGEPVGAAFWGTAKGMLLTRSYANDNDMNWAPPDLMKMGRPALQALKESGLKGDGYQALRKPSGLNFDNPTVVAGAGYMRHNGCNYNEAAQSSAQVDGLKMPTDVRERHRAAVQGVLTSKPENEAQRRETLRQSGDEIIAHDPAHKEVVEQERRGYKVDQSHAPKAENTARKNDATAKKDDAAAKQKDAKADVKEQAAASSKNKLGAALGL